MHAVAEGGRVADDRPDRQTQRQCHRATADHEAAAALGLHEPAPPAVTGPGVLAGSQTGLDELVVVGGGRHAGEPVDALGAQVVPAAADDDLGLAQGDLVDRLLQRHRRRGTRRDRVDHRSVAADQALVDVRGDHVAQRLLKHVVGDGAPLGRTHVEGMDRAHAAHPRALRVAHEARVDRAEQLLGSDPGVGQRVGGDDHVPGRQRVHRRGDTGLHCCPRPLWRRSRGCALDSGQARQTTDPSLAGRPKSTAWGSMQPGTTATARCLRPSPPSSSPTSSKAARSTRHGRAGYSRHRASGGPTWHC